MVGVMIQGLLTPLMMGLVFSNSTRQIASMTWQAALLNVVMNLFLIPQFGLVGAAISTLFCYALLAMGGGVRSAKHFELRIPWSPIILYGLAALLMFVVLKALLIYFPNTTLCTQIGIGVSVYAVLLFISDKRIRLMAIGQYHALVKSKLENHSNNN